MSCDIQADQLWACVAPLCLEPYHTKDSDGSKDGREGVHQADDHRVHESVVAWFAVAGQCYECSSGHSE